MARFRSSHRRSASQRYPTSRHGAKKGIVGDLLRPPHVGDSLGGEILHKFGESMAVMEEEMSTRHSWRCGV